MGSYLLDRKNYSISRVQKKVQWEDASAYRTERGDVYVPRYSDRYLEYPTFDDAREYLLRDMSQEMNDVKAYLSELREAYMVIKNRMKEDTFDTKEKDDDR